MPEPDQSQPRTRLTVGFVAGVSPDKWSRTWSERMPRVALELRPVLPAEAVAELGQGLDMVLARDAVDSDQALHIIDLWSETPVVVVQKDHPIKLFESITRADLGDENLLEGSDDAALDLVAAGVGVVVMPQAVLRATGRRDVVGRPVSDAEPTRISLVWRRGNQDEAMDEFIGIVRGRTANSSRGADATPPAKTPAAKQSSAKPKQTPAGKTKSRTFFPRASSSKRGGRSGRR